jgi:hypothetical protein
MLKQDASFIKDMYYDRIELDKCVRAEQVPRTSSRNMKPLCRRSKDYELRYDYAAEIFNWLYMDSKATAEQT